MLTPKVIIALKVPLVGLFLVVVHEVHVLNPALRIDDEGEPDAAKDVHNNEELEGHH